MLFFDFTAFLCGSSGLITQQTEPVTGIHKYTAELEMNRGRPIGARLDLRG
jgi:hypothetical protein